MPVKDFTGKNAVMMLATRSRRVDISTVELCKVHFEMGRYLAYQILDEFEMKRVDIMHVQGLREGFELADKSDITILSVMRAGLYAAEGIRSVFPESCFVLSPEEQAHFKDRIVIVVDAVINTGRSIREVIDVVMKASPRKIIIATLILQKDAVERVNEFQNITTYALRISGNKYVGKGETDTGNRLFNTFIGE